MKNQKGFIKNVIIIILAILLLAVGYFYYLTKNPTNAPHFVENFLEKIPMPGIGPLCCVKDETADWRIYSNEKYTFRIKLPPSWEFLDNNPAGDKMDFSFRDKKYNGSYEWPGFRISSTDYVGEFKDAKNRRSFVPSDAENNLIRILFDADGNKLYASCALYLDKNVIEKCNQTLLTFKVY